MEGAAPAAPAGGAASPDGGAAVQDGGAPAGAPPGGQPQAKSRGNDGRFLPKDGNVGTVPQGEGEGEAPKEPPKDPYRFKRKLKAYGEEFEVDLDEEGLARELQRARALTKRQAELAKFGESGREVLRIAKEDPEAFFRLTGQDAKEWARKQLARDAQLAAMSEEERRAHTLSEENATLKAQLERHTKAQEEQRKTAELEHYRQATIKRYSAAMERAGLPRTNQMLYLMAEAERDAIRHAEEQSLPAPDFSPDELAAEARHRVSEMVEGYLGGLDGPGLVKHLGAERVKAVLAAAIADYERSSSIPGVQPPAPRSLPEPKSEPEYIDEREVNRRMREFRNGKL